MLLDTFRSCVYSRLLQLVQDRHQEGQQGDLTHSSALSAAASFAVVAEFAAPLVLILLQNASDGVAGVSSVPSFSTLSAASSTSSLSSLTSSPTFPHSVSTPTLFALHSRATPKLLPSQTTSFTPPASALALSCSPSEPVQLGLSSSPLLLPASVATVPLEKASSFSSTSSLSSSSSSLSVSSPADRTPEQIVQTFLAMARARYDAGNNPDARGSHPPPLSSAASSSSSKCPPDRSRVSALSSALAEQAATASAHSSTASSSVPGALSAVSFSRTELSEGCLLLTV